MIFECPLCHRVASVDNSQMGTQVQCGHCKKTINVPVSRFSNGAVIGDFVIRRELSRGGMGIVYLAHQISLDRPAALKILQENNSSEEFVSSLIREARSAAKLNHPNIVQAYAVGEDEGIFYFAMEFIDGETMKDVLKREKVLAPTRAAEIIQEIAEALKCAWDEQKLIHQDIKPDNIMLTKNGHAKLADLGLSHVADGTIPDADSDEVLGTPQYISPEQLTGTPADIRSDIYSLGATFYQFVTGKFPYEAETLEELARKHVKGDLVPPREINPLLPESLNRIIVKMMKRNIDERYQSADDLIKDLIDFRQGKVQLGAFPTGKISLNNWRLQTGSNKLSTNTFNTGLNRQIRPNINSSQTATQLRSAPALHINAPENTISHKTSIKIRTATPTEEETLVHEENNEATAQDNWVDLKPQENAAPAAVQPIQPPPPSTPVILEDIEVDQYPDSQMRRNISNDDDIGMDVHQIPPHPLHSHRFPIIPVMLIVILFVTILVVIAWIWRINSHQGIVSERDSGMTFVGNIIILDRFVTENPDKKIEFLDKFDNILMQYPPTAEELEMEQFKKLSDLYVTLDESLRRDIMRKQARNEHLALISRKVKEREQKLNAAKTVNNEVDILQKQIIDSQKYIDTLPERRANLVLKFMEYAKSNKLTDANNVFNDVISDREKNLYLTPDAQNIMETFINYAEELKKTFDYGYKVTYALTESKEKYKDMTLSLRNGSQVKIDNIQDGVIACHVVLNDQKRIIELKDLSSLSLQQLFDRISLDMNISDTYFYYMLYNGDFQYNLNRFTPDKFWRQELPNFEFIYFYSLLQKCTDTEYAELYKQYGKLDNFKKAASYFNR